MPNASVLNYAQVPGLNIANAIIVPVRQDAEGNDVTVRADTSGIHLVVDVVGYFTPLAVEPLEKLRLVRGTVNGDGTILAGSGFSVSHPSTGEYLISLPLAGGPYTATASLGIASPGNSTVYTQGGNPSVQISVRTASLPADLAFSFMAVGAAPPTPIPIPNDGVP